VNKIKKNLERGSCRLPQPIQQGNIARQLTSIIIQGLILARHQHHLRHPRLIQPDSTVSRPSNTTTFTRTVVRRRPRPLRLRQHRQHRPQAPTLSANTAYQPRVITMKSLMCARLPLLTPQQQL